MFLFLQTCTGILPKPFLIGMKAQSSKYILLSISNMVIAIKSVILGPHSWREWDDNEDSLQELVITVAGIMIEIHTVYLSNMYHGKHQEHWSS